MRQSMSPVAFDCHDDAEEDQSCDGISATPRRQRTGSNQCPASRIRLLGEAKELMDMCSEAVDNPAAETIIGQFLQTTVDGLSTVFHQIMETKVARGQKRRRSDNSNLYSFPQTDRRSKAKRITAVQSPIRKIANKQHRREIMKGKEDTSPIGGDSETDKGN